MIGDEIELTILSVSGDKVGIGIQAPRDIPVFARRSGSRSSRRTSPPAVPTPASRRRRLRD